MTATSKDVLRRPLSVVAPPSGVLVLRDIAVGGKPISPGRPSRERRGHDGRRPSAAAAAALHGQGDTQQAALTVETSIDSEVELRYQRAQDEGFAQGLWRAEEEARQQLAQAARQAEQEWTERSERMAAELQLKAQTSLRDRVAQLDALLAQVPGQVQSRLAAAEDDMVALCFEVVCRILGELAPRPDVIQGQVAQAVTALRQRQLVAIHIHPDDLAAVQRYRGSAPADPGVTTAPWVASHAVALGGLILESPEGGLDARLDHQIQVLRDLLLRTRTERNGEAIVSDAARSGQVGGALA